jgi:hypothetical protein
MSMSTWFVTLNGKSIDCAETGHTLWLGSDGWRRMLGMGPVSEVSDDYALAMLTALGYEWRGGRIQPITAPAPAPGLTCYSPIGTSYPAWNWESCYAKWQEGNWFVEMTLLRTNHVWCRLGGCKDIDKRFEGRAQTIRAAFCAATTAYREAIQ